MPTKTKRRIQVQVSEQLANEAGQVFEDLGLTPTAAITMFYKRVVAENGLPFRPVLTDKEKMALKLIRATRKIPVKDIKTEADYENWVENGND